MVSGVRTTPPILGTMAVVRPIKGSLPLRIGAAKKDGKCGMAQDWAYAPTQSPFLSSTTTASFLRQFASSKLNAGCFYSRVRTCQTSVRMLRRTVSISELLDFSIGRMIFVRG